MADVELRYQGNTIGFLASSGTLTMETAGTYCEDDITLTYTQPSGGGTPTAEPNDVNFIDYDGTILYSYSSAEAQALTSLPANPSHDGLTAQGWNWTLAGIKSQLTNVGGIVNVGQMYVTSNGKTLINIHIDNDTPANRMTFYVRFTSSVENNTTIDWGDGTTEVKGSTTATNYPHTYGAAGDYVISLTVNSGTISFSGDSNNAVYGPFGTDNAYNRGRISAVYVGSNVTSIGDYAFYYCYGLQTITVPTGVTSIGNYSFQNCYSLQSVAIPDGATSVGGHLFHGCLGFTYIAIPPSVTSIGTNAFQTCTKITCITIPAGVTSIGNYSFSGCYSLQSVAIPDGATSIGNSVFVNCYRLSPIAIPDNVTSIGTNAFQACYSLLAVTIPDRVTSIAANAFQYCYGVSEYHFLPTTPPTLASTSSLSGIASDCIIYVPYSADHSILGAYQAATNWSTYASYMQEESQ